MIVNYVFVNIKGTQENVFEKEKEQVQVELMMGILTVSVVAEGRDILTVINFLLATYRTTLLRKNCEPILKVCFLLLV